MKSFQLDPAQKLEAFQAGRVFGLRRVPEPADGPAIVLLHGYGGDEKAMWVFASAIPASFPVIALRGIYPAESGGFRWHVGRRWPPPDTEVFAPAVEAIAGAMGTVRGIRWIGFSQGAASAYQCPVPETSGLTASGMFQPPGHRVDRLAGASPLRFLDTTPPHLADLAERP